MDKQGVPDLERMNEQQAQDFLLEMFTHLSVEAKHELRHEETVLRPSSYVEEWEPCGNVYITHLLWREWWNRDG